MKKFPLFVIALASLSAASVAWGACDPAKEKSPTSARYVTNGDTVYDKVSKLAWMRCSLGQRWEQGSGCVGTISKMKYAQAAASAGGGWRVPTLEELKTLVLPHCQAPVVDEVYFPGTPSDWYLTEFRPGDSCWVVDFGSGFVNDGSYDTGNCENGAFAVRLVRSGK